MVGKLGLWLVFGLVSLDFGRLTREASRFYGWGLLPLAWLDNRAGWALVFGNGSRKTAFFYWKMEKTVRRRPTMGRIAQFLPVARERNAESPVFYSSLVSET